MTDLERTIGAGLDAVHQRIHAACASAGRDPKSVVLVAVSKKHSADAVRAAYARGQRVFGENYVQELVEKAAALSDLRDIEWHLIGHLQRNKAKDVVRIDAVVETVDSERLALALAERARAENKTLSVMLQVNVAGEAQKSGVAYAEAEALAAAVRKYERLSLIGLMTVPPDEGADASRPHFARLRELAEQLGVSGLSMGMSADLEAAIEEGATHVRVGTSIFGAR